MTTASASKKGYKVTLTEAPMGKVDVEVKGPGLYCGFYVWDEAMIYAMEDAIKAYHKARVNAILNKDDVA